MWLSLGYVHTAENNIVSVFELGLRMDMMIVKIYQTLGIIKRCYLWKKFMDPYDHFIFVTYTYQ